GQGGGRTAPEAEPRCGRQAERAHGSALQRLLDGLFRLGMQLPKVANAPAGELLLEHGQVRIPAAAEILCAGAAGDAAVGEHEARAVDLRSALIGDCSVLAALDGRPKQQRRLEPDWLLAPDGL